VANGNIGWRGGNRTHILQIKSLLLDLLSFAPFDYWGDRRIRTDAFAFTVRCAAATPGSPLKFLTAADVIEHPPHAIEPVARCSCNTRGRQPEFFAMRVAHNSRSCRLLQRNFFLHSLNNSFPHVRGGRGRAWCFTDCATGQLLVRASGLEPELLASKASALPLSYTPIVTGAGARQSRARSKGEEVRRDFLETPSSLSLFRSELSAFSEQRHHQIG
jgi:hypothetical protein